MDFCVDERGWIEGNGFGFCGGRWRFYGACFADWIMHDSKSGFCFPDFETAEELLPVIDVHGFITAQFGADFVF